MAAAPAMALMVLRKLNGDKMAIYAVIENNTVTNTIVWDGVTAWIQPAGSTVIIIPDGAVAGIGYTYDVTTKAFTAPPETTGAGS